MSPDYSIFWRSMLCPFSIGSKRSKQRKGTLFKRLIEGYLPVGCYLCQELCHFGPGFETGWYPGARSGHLDILDSYL